MKLISSFKDKIETLKIELFEYHDLLMIFPSHRKAVGKWEKQNIRDDIKKLRNSKKIKRMEKKIYERKKIRGKHYI